MLTDAKIRSEMKTATEEKTLNGGTFGRGGGSLILRIRPGRKETTAVWLAYWRKDGQRGKKQIGRYPDLSLAEARAKYAEEVAPQVAAGKPASVIVTDDDKPTVGRMFEGYVANMRARNCASADEVERVLLKGRDNAADGLGRYRLASEIEPAELVDFIAIFFNRGARGGADKVRQNMSAAFGWALKSAHDYTTTSRQDWGLKMNPVAAIPKDSQATTPRDRNLSPAELRELWAATLKRGNSFNDETGAFIRALIAMGQRVRETLRMEGRDLDLEAGVWRMPAPKTKGRKRPHAIPIPASIMPTLQALVQEHGDGYLFKARYGSQSEVLRNTSVTHAITRWTKREGVAVARFQTRDLRRTWKSRTGEAGVDDFMRDVIQQHARGGTGAIFYDRADYRTRMREAMDKWDEWMRENVI